MLSPFILTRTRLSFLLVVAFAVCGSCVRGESAVAEPPPPPSPPHVLKPLISRLRVRNAGPLPVRQLVVAFEKARLQFGDVEVGATTDFQDVPGPGVLRYAAYRYSWRGQTITQPVIDFTGETPLIWGAYTYHIQVEPYGEAARVTLLEVVRNQ